VASSQPVSDSKTRLSALRELLSRGNSSTQEELAEALCKRRFDVTQSTISRDLRKISAVKAIDTSGRTVYRLPEENTAEAKVSYSTGLRGLMLDIQHNGAMIVIHTTPGSASLVARFLDQTKPNGILGTIAGDDTIFVAPASVKKINETITAIHIGLPV
jgi:transcriptional regulator of arginine metabolism